MVGGVALLAMVSDQTFGGAVAFPGFGIALGGLTVALAGLTTPPVHRVTPIAS